MNKLSGLLVASLLASFLMNAGAQQVAERSGSQSKIVERGSGHRVWETHESVSLGFGAVHVRTNQVTELATGLHYWDGNSWADSKEEIELVGNKAVARQGNHKVSFANNIATPGAIDVVAQDGKRFRSHVLGLSYYDASTGASVLIAEIKNAEGFLLPPNQILYVDAFTGLKADIRYTYTKAGLEQDVILREAPHSPAKYGLNPDTTRLEVLTEFLQAPNRTKKERTIRSQGDSRLRNEMVSPDLVDEVLDFGSMKMGAGKAFQLVPNGHTPSDTIPVGKQWQTLEGRDFLIEAVEYPMIKGHLGALPPTEANIRDRKSDKNVKVVAVKTESGKSIQRMLPDRLVAGVKTDGPIQIAKLAPQNHGVVLDYLLLGSSATNMIFAGGSTYLVSGEVVLDGTTTFEGGAVIKFTNTVSNARLRINGPVIWDTAAYRPAIFTAKDDNTVGENISGSTGSPTNYYAATALLFDNGMQNDLKHVRVSHAATAIEGASVTLTHAQIVNSGNGLALVGNSFGLHNVLFSGVQTNLYSTLAITGVVEHVTFNGANYLSASATNSHLLVTNSLIYAVTNYGPFVWSTNQVAVIGGTSPFTNVGSGWSYLPTNSPYLNLGATNISAGLRVEFAEMTTSAPLIFTNLVDSNVVLNPSVTRDTDQPDLGYHYYALDYAIGNCWVTNATLTLTNGVAFATYDLRGFWLMGGGRLVSEGSPLRMNRYIRYGGVQEMPQVWGEAPATIEMFNPYVGTNTPPTVKFRFSEFISTKSDVHFYTGYQDFAGWQVSDLDMRDCIVYGGTVRVDKGSASATDFKVINTVFDNTYVNCYYGLTNTLLLNNLYKGGTVYLRKSTNSPAIKDSVLLGTTTTQVQSSGVNADFNAYINQTNAFTPASTNNIFTNVAFISGPLGKYYQTNGSPLIDNGSQLASDVGLYHYTTTTNQVKETNSIVDIGVHYVALDLQGLPMDTDSDGIPDYLEDANGNGIADSGETDWQNADSDYDGRTDGQELLDGTDPLNASSVLPVRLGYWRFNSTNWVGEAGQLPLVATNLLNPSSWSGKAASISGVNSNLHLLNVDISGSTPTTMTGPAAIGRTTNDFWNTYYATSQLLKTITNLLWTDVSDSSVSMTVTNAPGSWGSSTGNRMYDDYNYPWENFGSIGVTFSNIAAGYYDFYFYCHGADSDQNAEVALYSGTNLLGGGFTEVTSDWASTNWVEGKQYVRISDVNVIENSEIKALIMPDGSSFAPFNGLQVMEKKVSQLKYRDVEPNGAANINLANGTIRFWFMPNWSGTNSGGKGPESEVRLLEMGQKSSSMSNGWWALSVNAEGSKVAFSAQGLGIETNYFVADINWTSNVWHQIVLTYTPSNSNFYVDGQSVTNGMGSTLYPGIAVRSDGFSMGSNQLGLKQADGQVEEWETFNYPLTAEEILTNYEDSLEGDLDGDGIPNFQDANSNTSGIGLMKISIKRPKNGEIIP